MYVCENIYIYIYIYIWRALFYFEVGFPLSIALLITILASFADFIAWFTPKPLNPEPCSTFNPEPNTKPETLNPEP